MDVITCTCEELQCHINFQFGTEGGKLTLVISFFLSAIEQYTYRSDFLIVKPILPF